MNKSDLINIISEKTQMHRKRAEEFVNLVFDSMIAQLVNGGRIEIRGFGSFAVKSYESYTGRNPRTGELIQVKPKRLPYFKVGKELRAIVDDHSEGDANSGANPESPSDKDSES